MGHGFNEVGTLSHSPADSSNDLLPPTPAHATNLNQSFPTTSNELTGSADQELVGVVPAALRPLAPRALPVQKKLTTGFYSLNASSQLSERKFDQKGLVWM